MGKVIDEGWAKPTDKIYGMGWVVGSKHYNALYLVEGAVKSMEGERGEMAGGNHA